MILLMYTVYLLLQLETHSPFHTDLKLGCHLAADR